MLDPVGVPAEPVTFMIYQEQTENKSKCAALSPVSKRANFRSSPGFFARYFTLSLFLRSSPFFPAALTNTRFWPRRRKRRDSQASVFVRRRMDRWRGRKGLGAKNATNEFPPLCLSLSPLPRLSLNPHSRLLSDCATVSFSLRSIGRGRKKSSKALQKGWLRPTFKKIV